MWKRKGFTLLELLIVLSIMTVLYFITFPRLSGVYERFLLQKTGREVMAMCRLAQQLSLDQSREFSIEFTNSNRTYRLREHITGGKVIRERQLNSKIRLQGGSSQRVTYNRDGNSNEAKFVLVNSMGQTVEVQVLLGTGRVMMLLR